MVGKAGKEEKLESVERGLKGAGHVDGRDEEACVPRCWHSYVICMHVAYCHFSRQKYSALASRLCRASTELLITRLCSPFACTSR